MNQDKLWFVNIVAMSSNGVIGADNKLPWRLPGELREFTKTIKDRILVMGKNTCESLPRKQNDSINYVLTTDKEYEKEGYIIIHSIDELLPLLPKGQPVYVIGGASIYKQVIELSDREDVILTNEITIVQKEYEGDAKFPIEMLKKRGYYRKRLMGMIEKSGAVWVKYLYYENEIKRIEQEKSVYS